MISPPPPQFPTRLQVRAKWEGGRNLGRVPPHNQALFPSRKVMRYMSEGSKERREKRRPVREDICGPAPATPPPLPLPWYPPHPPVVLWSCAVEKEGEERRGEERGGALFSLFSFEARAQGRLVTGAGWHSVVAS